MIFIQRPNVPSSEQRCHAVMVSSQNADHLGKRVLTTLFQTLLTEGLHITVGFHSTAADWMNFPVELFNQLVTSSPFPIEDAKGQHLLVLNAKKNRGSEKVLRTCGDEIMQPRNLTEDLPVGKFSSGLSVWTVKLN